MDIRGDGEGRARQVLAAGGHAGERCLHRQRSLAPDEAFIALRGLNRDGHAFVEAALSQGASCAIVEQDFKAPRGEKRLLRVADTLQALNDLGTASRARAKDAAVIAVTGSVGKTGTKEALKIALMPSGLVHVSLKSHNNHWGVPLSLANMRQDTNFGVFEAGMNHAGELSELTRPDQAHIAIITTGGAGASRLLPLRGRDRRRQGRDPRRPGAWRRRHPQPWTIPISSGSGARAAAQGAYRELRRDARQQTAESGERRAWP
jgi:hypothetical protein